MDTYKLKNSEKQLLSYISKPYEIGKKRRTRPVIVEYDWNGNVVGLSSIRQWRSMLKALPTFKDDYQFELLNLWL